MTSFKVGVVGLGRLGLPLAAVYAAAGHDVFGVDTNPAVVGALHRGYSPLKEAGLDNLLDGAWGNLRFFTDHAVLADRDVVSVIVPTPSRADHRFDPTHVIEACRAMGLHLRPGALVAVCSTVMPGDTAGPIRAALPEHVEVLYSPEFIALGSVIEDLRHPDMILIGADTGEAADRYEALQRTIVGRVVPAARLSVVDAEIAKLTVNAFVTMRLAFANALGELCENIPGADAHEVVAAVGLDSRIGCRYLRPAASFGGPCFPRDSEAFQTLVPGTAGALARATDEINRDQTGRLCCKALAAREAAGGNGRVAVLGLAYKAGTPVAERSAGLALVGSLVSAACRVRCYDPHADCELAARQRVATVEEALDGATVVVITTPWPEFADIDYGDRVVIDCWGIVPGVPNGRLIRVGVNEEVA